MKDLVLLILGLASAVAVGALLEANAGAAGSKESFGNIPAQTFKRIPEVRVQNQYGSNMFSVPPNWQGNLPPRFSNTGYGAYILYNIPEEGNLAVPKYPLTYKNHYQDYPLTMGGAVKESYASEAGVNPMRAAELGAVNAYQGVQAQMAANGFVQDAREGKYLVGSEVLPEGTQIYNYDRLVYAQKRSRLHGQGDPIRGDLAIIPIYGEWFRPSVSPNIDLRQGAITTISGDDNSTSRETRALAAAFSGKTALAQKDISFDNRQSDLFITSFP